MAWIRTLGLRHMAIVAKLDQSAGWTFGIDSKQGRLSLLFLVGGQPVIGVEGTIPVNDGAWHLVATTYDGSGRASGMQLYVDGAAVVATVGGDSLGTGSILNSGPLSIGAEPDGSDGFEGNMNDVAVFGTALTPAQILQLAGDTAISKAVLGQFAFGGGWYSAIYLTNTGLNTVSFPVSFIGDNGSPLSIPSIGGPNKTVTLASGASTVIEALNNVPDLRQGYVSVILPPGVTGYGVFRQSVPGVPDQEAVVPLSAANSSNIPMVYDETNFITGVSIVNPSGVAVTVGIAATDTSGTVIGTSSVVLQPFCKTAVALRTLPVLNQIVGTRGTVRFTAGTGNIAVLGLRFNGPAFTSIPAAPQTFKFVGAN